MRTLWSAQHRLKFIYIHLLVDSRFINLIFIMAVFRNQPKTWIVLHFVKDIRKQSSWPSQFWFHKIYGMWTGKRRHVGTCERWHSFQISWNGALFKQKIIWVYRFIHYFIFGNVLRQRKGLRIWKQSDSGKTRPGNLRFKTPIRLTIAHSKVPGVTPNKSVVIWRVNCAFRISLPLRQFISFC